MRRGIWIAGASLAAIAAAVSVAQARTIKIFNQTPYAMVTLEAKKPDADKWGDDMIGKSSLGVGKVRRVDLDTTDCHFDLRATFDDGHKVEKKSVDMCTVEIYSFTDE